MSVYIQNFVKFKPFLKELVSRDVKVKYRRSILGVLWTLLNPLLMMTVLSIVFSNLFKFDIENFPLYLLCGNGAYICYVGRLFLTFSMTLRQMQCQQLSGVHL